MLPRHPSPVARRLQSHVSPVAVAEIAREAFGPLGLSVKAVAMPLDFTSEMYFRTEECSLYQRKSF